MSILSTSPSCCSIMGDNAGATWTAIGPAFSTTPVVAAGIDSEASGPGAVTAETPQTSFTVPGEETIVTLMFITDT